VGPLGFGNSPYSALSAFAGSPLLLSPELLAREGLLSPAALRRGLRGGRRVDYARAVAHRERLLRAAHERFAQRRPPADLERFCAESSAWLEDWALYAALKARHGGGGWTNWPAELRARSRGALEAARRELQQELSFHRFVQWQFSRQWRALRAACAARGVRLLGDLPIFVAHDSADVWAHQELFFLDQRGLPSVIAGVPPDYFSRTGQRWGNPLYRWNVLRSSGYRWWIQRLGQMLERFDAVRLDHFIGFTRYWEIPADEPTAVGGKWRPGPGAHFFSIVQSALGGLPLVAEDLGAVTEEVTALRDQFHFPGLRILQFAFGTDPQAPTFKPHAYPRNTVAYSGTHDNDTAQGWFNDPGHVGGTRSRRQIAIERAFALRYLGSRGGGAQVHWDMIRALYASVADLVIVPMQDALGLGSEARMNHPGTLAGNWEWRADARALSAALARKLRGLAETYDRAPAAVEPRPAVARSRAVP
jgi:4-alpha-glucanotransferase